MESSIRYETNSHEINDFQMFLLQLLPKNAAPTYVKREHIRRNIPMDKKKEKSLQEPHKPGFESYRKTREKLTT